MCQSTMACVGQWEVVFVVREEYGGVFLSRGKPLRWAFRFQFMHPPLKKIPPPLKKGPRSSTAKGFYFIECMIVLYLVSSLVLSPCYTCIPTSILSVVSKYHKYVSLNFTCLYRLQCVWFATYLCLRGVCVSPSLLRTVVWYKTVYILY